MPTKMVVSSESALKHKYGKSWTKVKLAVARMAKVDAKQGITTTFVALDAVALGTHRATGGDMASFKRAVDFVFAREKRPDYVVILGGPDVVPHQALRNPIGDDDADVPSDLPYACSAPDGDETESFLAPTRVCGRIPDLPGATTPRRLIALIDAAAAWRSRPKADYGSFFGVSAHKWRKSTTLSLRALFGSSAAPLTSPLAGPAWKNADLAHRVHFINCHGAPIDPQFYGQKGEDFPVALQSVGLPGHVTHGTVVAAECCYGAEVYEPDPGAPAGICIHYLDHGAIGFMGSTNTAYGPSTTNGDADLICRFFLDAVLKGASLGRALLEARLRFVKEASPLGPTELKTLGQFLLLGDPSLRPVATAGTGTTKAGVKGAKALGKAMSAHADVRGQLNAEAAVIAKGADCVASQPDHAAPPSIRQQMDRVARDAGCVPVAPPETYRVRQGIDPAARFAVAGAAKGAKSFAAAKKKLETPIQFHVLISTPQGSSQPAQAKAMEPSHTGKAAQPKPFGLTERMLLVAREEGGKVVEMKQLFSHGASGSQYERILRRRRR